MDYKCIDIQDGGIRRMRDINVWKKNIKSEKQIEMFKNDDKQLEPSTKKRDSSFYRKRKTGKKSNMMLRGKALLQYRKEILEEIE